MCERLRRARERGSAAVEFALVLPILVLIMMGIIDFGMVTNAQAISGNAARDGARVASMGGNANKACQAALSAASSLVGFQNTGDCSTSTPQVTVTCLDAAGNDCSGSFNDKRAVNGTVVVTVVYKYNWISPGILGLPGFSNVVNKSYMRIETLS